MSMFPPGTNGPVGRLSSAPKETRIFTRSCRQINIVDAPQRAIRMRKAFYCCRTFPTLSSLELNFYSLLEYPAIEDDDARRFAGRSCGSPKPTLSAWTKEANTLRLMFSDPTMKHFIFNINL